MARSDTQHTLGNFCPGVFYFFYLFYTRAGYRDHRLVFILSMAITPGSETRQVLQGNVNEIPCREEGSTPFEPGI
jgi:hypothetical protein